MYLAVNVGGGRESICCLFGNSICPVRGSIWPHDARPRYAEHMRRVGVGDYKTPRLSVGLRLRDTFGDARTCLHCAHLFRRAAQYDKRGIGRRAPRPNPVISTKAGAHCVPAVRRNLPGYKSVISSKRSAAFAINASIFDEREQDAKPKANPKRRNLPCCASDTFITTPRSVRRVYPSTLRRIGSKSLKHRTREEGAGEGEFAFTECRNFYLILAQNCSICAKEEPQAQKAYKADMSALLQNKPCGDEEKSPRLLFRYYISSIQPPRRYGEVPARMSVWAERAIFYCSILAKAWAEMPRQRAHMFTLRPPLSARCSA